VTEHDAEVAAWRRTHTYGGFVWTFLHDEAPKPKRKPLVGAELLEEVEHLLWCRVHPLVIASQLERTVESIHNSARTQKNRRVMNAFSKSALEVA
jgi:hypothetical protein